MRTILIVAIALLAAAQSLACAQPIEHIDVRTILERLDSEDLPARRALILSLGDLGREELPVDERAPLTTKLLELYRDDPDPGIHAAIEWLLRHSQQGERRRALNWQQAETVTQIDQELAGRPPNGRGWMVTPAGYTMAIVPGVLILLRADGEVYRYHARRNGTPFYCPTDRVEAPVSGQGQELI